MPYCDVDGARLYYEVADYTDPWRPADTVLLHHAAMGTLTRWYAWVPLLARHFRVVRFDVRGHGSSSTLPPGYVWSIDDLARDVVGLLDHLGVDAVHYVGASAGGNIGIWFAHQYPERVKTLTFAPVNAKMTESRADYGEWLEIIGAEGVEAFLLKNAPERFNADVDQRLVGWFAREGGRNPAHVVAGFAAHMATHDQRSLLPELRMPTLLIGAGADDITPPETQYYLRDHLPDAELVMLEGLKHNISSSVPERCAHLMLDFLERRGFLAPEAASR